MSTLSTSHPWPGGTLLALDPAMAPRLDDAVDRYGRGQATLQTLRAEFGGGSRQQPARAAKSVAVVSLYGVLTPGSSLFTVFGFGTSLAAFAATLRDLANDTSVTSVIILTDSPGGAVAGVEEALIALRHLRSRKPVYAAVVYAASGAYWIISGATSIWATPSAEVGSIGVYLQRVSLARQLEREGIDVNVIRAGKFKGEGNPTQQMSDAERAASQKRVDDVYADFVGAVASGRGVDRSTVQNRFGEGRMVTTRDALRVGMIDGIEIVETLVAQVVAGKSLRAASEGGDDEFLGRLRAIDGPYSTSTSPTARAEEDDEEQRERWLRY